MKKQVFYSFHYDNDVFRVHQIRNIGAVEGNTPVVPNTWEEIKRKGNAAIEKWIDDNMKYRSCVVVLVGEETASRPWVQYEIKKAWRDGKGLVGIYIHRINCMKNGMCSKGINPFEQIDIDKPKLFYPRRLSDVVKCYDPGSDFSEMISRITPYQSISNNLESWVDEAISIRKNF